MPFQIAEPFAKNNDLFELTPESIGSFDWADTAGIIANLRLIITVDTGVANLAGAMGAPTWIIVSAWPDWRWGHSGETTPCFDSVRIFRHGRAGDWFASWLEILETIAEQAGLPYRKIEPIKLTVKQEFLAKYDAKFDWQLVQRAKTFRKVFEVLKEGPIIVETGTLRTTGNWAGDGCSTIMFDEYCQALGGQLWSVDISPESTAAAKPLVSGRTILVTQDSVEFLKGIRVPVDLLYLDSMDGHLPGCDEHQMAEFEAAQHVLKSGSIVFVDDITTKGRKLIPHMDDVVKAPRVITGPNQIAWRMP
jgi:hypothetical protein